MTRRDSRAPDPEVPGWLLLVAKIVRRVPRLDGALCATRDARLFDGHTEADRERAAAICQRCPALDECRSWFNRMPPPRRPRGVVAGRYRDPQVSRVDES